MRKALALALVALGFALVVACGRSSDPLAPERAVPPPAATSMSVPKPIQRATGASPQLPTRFVHLSGTSGTVVVPPNEFVTSIWAHNTSGGGTLTIAPTGPNLQSPCSTWDAGPDLFDAAADAGPDTYDGAPPATCQDGGTPITIPALTAWSVAIPVLTGNPNELGPGSVLTFTSTDSYALTLTYYGP